MGLNTSYNLSPSHSFHKSLYHMHKSFFSNHSSNSINNLGMQNQKNQNKCFGAYLNSMSTQHRNLHPARWPILFCGPTQKLVLATANTGKTREKFWKHKILILSLMDRCHYIIWRLWWSESTPLSPCSYALACKESYGWCAQQESFAFFFWLATIL